MLACYLTWHLRAALAELTLTDQHIPAAAADPVAPAQRSAQARAKDAAKRTSDKLPVRKYEDLLSHLSTLSRQTISFGGQKIDKLTTPTPVQRQAFELLGTPSRSPSRSHPTRPPPAASSPVSKLKPRPEASRSHKFGLSRVVLEVWPARSRGRLGQLVVDACACR